MTRRMHGPAVIAFASLLALGAASLRAATGAGMTTGDLAVQLARAAGIALPDAEAPKAALKSLRKVGIELGSDPGAPATQDDLVRAGRLLGVPVASARPTAPVTAAMCIAFIQAATVEVQSAAAASGLAKDDTAQAACQGRESRAGREGTPASPADPSATAPPCDPQP